MSSCNFLEAFSPLIATVLLCVIFCFIAVAIDWIVRRLP